MRITLIELVIMIAVAAIFATLGFQSGCVKKGATDPQREKCFEDGGWTYNHTQGCIYKNPTKD